MHPKLEKSLERWQAAGLLDAAAAARIRSFESQQDQSGGMRWPVVLALSLGGLLMAAGVLLFVAAHWDELSPAARFALVLLMVGVFHTGGALAAERFAALASVLHAVGTVTLGAGIFLAGQIFHLQEHWPGGVMMWAAGAWIGWALLRDWPQAALAAVLTPAWLAGEWLVATERLAGGDQLLHQSLLLLALTYISLRTNENDTQIRRALMWIGGVALIPCAVLASDRWWGGRGDVIPRSLLTAGWLIGMGAPIALAYWLRGRAAWMNLVAALWVAGLGAMTAITHEEAMSDLFLHFWRDFGLYLWLWLGSVGLIAWGFKELRRERVNLGVACFGITTIFFYFASVMDKLGRSISLIGLGVLFLVGGWFLERARRRLLARLNAGGAA
ncbi:MAG: DUF2157 domain-containing protein [Candidatus Acidiferrales bacterium]